MARPGIDRDGRGLPRRRHGTSGLEEPYHGMPCAPAGVDTRTPGGVLFISRSGQRIWSVGGVFVPRKVTVPDRAGGVASTTTFTDPSAFHAPTSLRDLRYGRGILKVAAPDAHGLLY